MKLIHARKPLIWKRCFYKLSYTYHRFNSALYLTLLILNMCLKGLLSGKWHRTIFDLNFFTKVFFLVMHCSRRWKQMLTNIQMLIDEHSWTFEHLNLHFLATSTNAFLEEKNASASFTDSVHCFGCLALCYDYHISINSCNNENKLHFAVTNRNERSLLVSGLVVNC